MADVTSNEAEQGLRINTQFSSDTNNRHSYFLRAKMPRSFVEFQESDDHEEDGGFKKLSYGEFGLEKSSKSNFDDGFCGSHEDEDLAKCLVMLSNKSYALTTSNEENKVKEEEEEKGAFQCKACKKVFNSHQALGGHRASHKKVKGCFAAKMVDQENIDQDEEDHDHLPTPSDPITITKAPKMHECSVCRRVFSSGQALGGHKRCHWLTNSSDNTFIPNFHYEQLYKKPTLLHKPDIDHHRHHHHHQLDLKLNLSDYAETRADNMKIETTNVAAENRERECEGKLKKLSDLMDVNLDGGWLKMGIASTSTI